MFYGALESFTSPLVMNDNTSGGTKSAMARRRVVRSRRLLITALNCCTSIMIYLRARLFCILINQQNSTKFPGEFNQQANGYAAKPYYTVNVKYRSIVSIKSLHTNSLDAIPSITVHNVKPLLMNYSHVI